MVPKPDDTEACKADANGDAAVVAALENDDRTFKAVFLDLDGTLLRSNHKLSDRTVEYLRDLDAKGFFVAIATGRDISTVYEHIIKLNFPSHPTPVICSNGARGLLCNVEKPTNISDDAHVTFDVLFETPVPKHVATEVIQLSKSLGCCCQFYVAQKIYADPSRDQHFEHTEKYQQLTGCETVYVKDDFRAALEIGLPSKMLVLCADPDSILVKFQSHMEATFANPEDRPTLIRGNWFLEVLHPSICKGVGLEKMCKHFHMPLSEVIAFGDGDNDLEFIQMAGRGVVMKNGRDMVKEAGDVVIPYTNDEDGVIQTLKVMEFAGHLRFGAGLGVKQT
uniref:Sucrose phosphatase-like domain-containing protein n=1 Tax=Craspedostauros australis TaxID=1486917 RepID=A0A7R9ZS72_9STRA|mmetsp:Transcript_8158/g.22137  ORF Transcript_8158/g.22137 Transcript_8158/m.22137 type:complete len:336 (+) Transcript_8158:129-1136(+)|eukprot:CAMPEP_0198116736 /NCGR_PEP_ID=MMETSP1442-20131203/14335_1 /TAXON_ID= /ORGANISM="Craspedostauros australis, Strain CCMP3328" /LENGTH=335 /DNA_ID=CAMNT_0043774633 /DNA_START=56 /DNA_END=1063 /DNA_ORIENTATION=-